MFDDIVMNIFSNKALNLHMEVVRSYFTKIENKTVYMYIGSLKGFY